jgi:hypothetical protein
MRLGFVVALSVGLMLSGASYAQGIRGTCHVRTLCPDVESGGGKVMACLRAHKDELSQECLAAIGRRVLNRQGGGQSGANQMGGDGPDGADSSGPPPKQ